MRTRRFFGSGRPPDEEPDDVPPRDDSVAADEEVTQVAPAAAPTEEYRDVRDTPPVEEVEHVRAAGPPPERNWWPWLLALLLLVLGGLAAAYFLTRDNGKKTVPSVVGRVQADAVARLQADGFKTQVQRTFNSQPKGVVVRTEPAAGTKVDKGSTVTVFVSKGPAVVTVPNLRGLTEADAASKLTSLGLKANVFRVAASQAAGTVIAQNPAPDAQVQKGTAVRINVSKGVTQTSTTTVVTPTTTTSTTTTQTTTTTATTTAPSTATTATTSTNTGTPTGASASPPPPPVKKVSLPDVTGQNEQSAAAQLASAGLLADSYPVSSNEPGGTVLAERPASGRVPSGSVVRLNVAVGPGPRTQKAISSVKGLDEKTARSRLRASGFTVRAVYRTTKNKAFEKKVIFQTPGAGDHARAYFQVTIYVGRLAGGVTGTTTASTG